MESRNGDFYVQQGCCLSCGVPQEVAPTLVGWRDNQNSTDCYWIRQRPEPQMNSNKPSRLFMRRNWTVTDMLEQTQRLLEDSQQPSVTSVR